MNELFTRHLITAEECSEVASKERWDDLSTKPGQPKWAHHLNQVLLTKPAEVVQKACQVLEKHGCPVKKELKSEFYYSSTLCPVVFQVRHVLYWHYRITRMDVLIGHVCGGRTNN